MSGRQDRGVVIGGIVVAFAVIVVGLWLSQTSRPAVPAPTTAAAATPGASTSNSSSSSSSPPPPTTAPAPKAAPTQQLREKLDKLSPEERQQIAAVLKPFSTARPVNDDAPRLPPPTGTLSKESVQAAIQSVKPRIAACYDSALKGEPELAGTVVVSFSLVARDGVGVVDSGLIDDERSTAKSLFFQACVLEAVGNAPFEAPTDGTVNVTYPFRFESSPAEAPARGDDDGGGDGGDGGVR